MLILVTFDPILMRKLTIELKTYISFKICDFKIKTFVQSFHL